MKNFESTLDKIYEGNPFIISVLVDFKSHNWCKDDIISHDGSMIDAVMSNCGLHQLIPEPTHILNLSSPCTDLIFKFQPNSVIDLGAHSSLHPNCHHQVVFGKFNLSILYPPLYERKVWFYEKANPEFIRRAINEFDWIRALSNVSIDRKVCYFTETVLNIIHNFLPYERNVCDDRDPPRMNSEINHTAVLIEMCFFSKSLNFCKTN